jgi:four helix bundle protein
MHEAENPGVMEYWSNGVMLKNKNRGYQQLRVWQDAIEFYKLSWKVFGRFPYQLRTVASQGIASSDSIHRNIAEGYCRRSIREYLNFLNFALGSLGESVSGIYAYKQAGQIDEAEFKLLDEQAYKLEKRTTPTRRKPRTQTVDWRLDRHADCKGDEGTLWL